MLLVFGFVHITWVFFRAKDFGTAATILDRMLVAPFTGHAGGAQLSARFLVLFVPLLALHGTYLVRERLGTRMPAFARAVLAGLMLAAIVVVRRGTAREFVYFQF